MLGLLLNAVRSATKIATDLTYTYRTRDNIFGSGTYNYMANQFTEDKTIQSVYTTTNTLEFENFHVPEDKKLKAVLYPAGDMGASGGPFQPLVLKCSGTLQVDGEITSSNTGGYDYRWDGSHVYYGAWNNCKSPVSIDRPGYSGWSCSTNNFYKLAAYGGSGTFLDGNTVFIGGGSGGGQNYKRGRGHSRHKDVSANIGFTAGGAAFSGDDGFFGSGGGFVALYFEHLYFVDPSGPRTIKDLTDETVSVSEYGIDACPQIIKISANGSSYGYVPNSYGNTGGGTIIIAAKNIIIGAKGTINSNGGHHNTNYPWRYSVMNNLPQLSSSEGNILPAQTGHVMQQNGIVIPNTTNLAGGYYAYSDGFNTYSIDGYSSPHVGGAGVALGYKIKLID